MAALLIRLVQELMQSGVVQLLYLDYISPAKYPNENSQVARRDIRGWIPSATAATGSVALPPNGSHFLDFHDVADVAFGLHYWRHQQRHGSKSFWDDGGGVEEG